MALVKQILIRAIRNSQSSCRKLDFVLSLVATAIYISTRGPTKLFHYETIAWVSFHYESLTNGVRLTPRRQIAPLRYDARKCAQTRMADQKFDSM